MRNSRAPENLGCARLASFHTVLVRQRVLDYLLRWGLQHAAQGHDGPPIPTVRLSARRRLARPEHLGHLPYITREGFKLPPSVQCPMVAHSNSAGIRITHPTATDHLTGQTLEGHCGLMEHQFSYAAFFVSRMDLIHPNHPSSSLALAKRRLLSHEVRAQPRTLRDGPSTPSPFTADHAWL